MLAFCDMPHTNWLWVLSKVNWDAAQAQNACTVQHNTLSQAIYLVKLTLPRQVPDLTAVVCLQCNILIGRDKNRQYHLFLILCKDNEQLICNTVISTACQQPYLNFHKIHDITCTEHSTTGNTDKSVTCHIWQ